MKIIIGVSKNGNQQSNLLNCGILGENNINGWEEKTEMENKKSFATINIRKP